MNKNSRKRYTAAVVALAIFLAIVARPHYPARAQFTPFTGKFNLSDAVRLDEASSGALAQLERARALVADGQFDDALQTWRRVAESDGRKVVAIEPRRYVGVRDFCHAQIAALPDDALARYRRGVDPLAEKWYRRAVAQRDERKLRHVVEQFFCSRWADDALLALGDMALEQGDAAGARACWLSLFEVPPRTVRGEFFEPMRMADSLTKDEAALLDRYYVRYAARQGDKQGPAWYVRVAATTHDLPNADSSALVRLFKSRGWVSTRLAYPATDVPLAEIRARIVLADVMEGAFDDAADGLARLREVYPTARGYLAGQDGVLVERLTKLLAEARTWPREKDSGDWPTFAGSPERNKTLGGDAALASDFRQPAWRIDLGKKVEPDVPTQEDLLQSQHRQPQPVGETWFAPLGYHPVSTGGLVFVATTKDIRAIDVRTGKPAWSAGAGDASSVIYRDEEPKRARGSWRSRGVPRCTLTVQGPMLIARMGSAVTARPADEDRDAAPRMTSRLVVLDIGPSGQGKLLRDPIEPDDDAWAFEGTPVTDGSFLYVAMRRSDVRPQQHVACYDLNANPPRLRWRTFVAAAETPGSGRLVEYTHNLLTLRRGTIYVNTNLGAVAALAADDGRVKWLYAYPRARLGDLLQLAKTPHFFRDLNPCVFHRGIVLAAPADTPDLLALDADTGQLLWTTDDAQDVVHLLGVRDGQLIASGKRLYAIDVRLGRVVYRWPDGPTEPETQGMGRGAIARNQVIWPTADDLYVFDATASRDQKTWVMKRPPISLARLTKDSARGGNLLIVDNRLVVTGTKEMFAVELDGAK